MLRLITYLKCYYY